MSDRAAWLAERRSGVGASDVAGIVGTSPWSSPWSVWADKVGLIPLDDSDAATPSMRLGLGLEPLIARWFHDETGLHVAGEQTLVRHRRAAHHFATVDGFVLDAPDDDVGDALGVLESKYTAEAWDELPAHYADQVQWQLHCSGLPHAWVAALQLPFGRPRFVVKEIEPDKKRIDELVAKVDAFWHDHVLTGVAPPADDHRATTAAITAAWGHLDSAKMAPVAFDELRDVVDELADLRARRAAIAKLIERRENSVKAHFGKMAELLDEARTEGVIDGDLAVSWRARSRCDIDAAAVRADHGDRYDRHSVNRVLLLHGRRAP